MWFSPEFESNPARVNFVAIPSKETVKTKAFFNVIESSLLWHPDGTYLCLRNTLPSAQLARRIRQGKAKQEDYAGQTTTSLELFRMTEWDFPVDLLTCKNPISCFSWEPNGHRFAVVHSISAPPPSIASSPVVSVFDLSASGKGREIKKPAPFILPTGVPVPDDVNIISDRLTETMRVSKTCNYVAWSPFGRFCVFAQLDVGSLAFVDVDESKVMVTDTHHKANYVCFDPSGLYVCSAKTQPLVSTAANQQVENGFSVWSFQGHRLFSDKKDSLFQMLWRPRPTMRGPDSAVLNPYAMAKASTGARDEYLREKNREKLRQYIRKQAQYQAYEYYEQAGAAVYQRTKPDRARLGVVDPEDAGLLVPLVVDVAIVHEKVEALP